MTEVLDRPATFRQQFPLLSDTVHLASCSLAPRSAALDDAMERMLELLRVDPSPWDQWLAEVEQARQRFARLIGAAPHEVGIVPSATVGAYQVASTLDWSARTGIVSTAVEYSSIAQVWLAQRARGAEVTSVPERAGVVLAEDYVEAIDERTALVSVPLLSYRNGARMPLDEVVGRARQTGARVFVDAYQAAGVVPIDVGALGCDYLVSGVMKYLLGVPGIAFLYVRDGVRDDRSPQLTGWYGRPDPLAFDPTALDFADDASRFQVNMPTLPAAMAGNAGLGLIERVDVADVERHADGLAQRAIAQLEDRGVRLSSPTSQGQRGPQVAVATDDPMGMAASLNAQRVFPARGHVVRLSFHYFNNAADVDVACEAIGTYASRDKERSHHVVL